MWLCVCGCVVRLLEMCVCECVFQEMKCVTKHTLRAIENIAPSFVTTSSPVKWDEVGRKRDRKEQACAVGGGFVC